MGKGNLIKHRNRKWNSASCLAWEVIREEGPSLCVSTAERALIYFFSILLSTPTPFSSTARLVSSNYLAVRMWPQSGHSRHQAYLSFHGEHHCCLVQSPHLLVHTLKKRYLFAPFICPSQATQVIHRSLVRQWIVPSDHPSTGPSLEAEGAGSCLT